MRDSILGFHPEDVVGVVEEVALGEMVVDADREVEEHRVQIEDGNDWVENPSQNFAKTPTQKERKNKCNIRFAVDIIMIFIEVVYHYEFNNIKMSIPSNEEDFCSDMNKVLTTERRWQAVLILCLRWSKL